MARRKTRRNARRTKRNGRRYVRLNKATKAELSAAATLTADRGKKGKGKGSKKKRRSSEVIKAANARKAISRVFLKQARVLREKAAGMKGRSVAKSEALTQARRLSTLRRVALSSKTGPSQSPVYKAMHLKTNPSAEGLLKGVKTVLPQAAVGGVVMCLSALAGKWISDQITTTADPAVVATAAVTAPATVVATTAAPGALSGLGAVRELFVGADKKPHAIVKFMPAITTASLSVGVYMLANKYAPKYKGAVVIGGMLAAVVQAIAAAARDDTAGTGVASKASKAFGLGDYTTVGQRAYAEAGIFRNIGDYTTVGEAQWDEARQGGAYSSSRPRNTGDNLSEWATAGLGWNEADDGGAYSAARPRNTLDNRSEMSLHGMDDTTEFSSDSNEGMFSSDGSKGIKALSGGMFRGPDSR